MIKILIICWATISFLLGTMLLIQGMLVYKDFIAEYPHAIKLSSNPFKKILGFIKFVVMVTLPLEHIVILVAFLFDSEAFEEACWDSICDSYEF